MNIQEEKESEWPSCRNDKAIGIKEAPHFQMADSLGTGKEAPRFQGFDSEPAIQKKCGGIDDFTPPKRKTYEASRDLEELRFMVRREMREEEERRTREAEEQLRRAGEDLRLEIQGLLAQGNREGIPIWIYVLSHLHEDTIYTRTDQRRVHTPQDTIVWILQEVRTRVGADDHIQVIYVTPQPPPHWRWGEDALHVIADIRPWMGGIPVLVASMFDEGADENHPELGAYRSRESLPCQTLLRAFGKMRSYGERHAKCICHHDFLEKGERQILRLKKGDRIDLKRKYTVDEAEEEEEDEFACLQKKDEGSGKGQEDEHEEMALMVARDLKRRKKNTAYAYIVDEDEPRFFAGIDMDKHELRWHIWETMTQSPSKPQGAKYEVFEVKPNPDDLESKGIQGYIVEEHGERAHFQTVILLDIEVMANQAITMEGRRIFNEEWRAVERVNDKLTRWEFLREIQALKLCKKSGTCILTMGGKPWREQDSDTWWLAEGTYGILRIHNQWPDIPVNCQWKWAQEEVETEDFEEKWKKEKGSKQRRSREDEQEARNENEEQDELMTMIQRDRPSVAKQGQLKLPPPGNGKVTFDDKIRFCEGGQQRKRRDRAMSNNYIKGMYKGMRNEGNPYIQGFLEGMRYEEVGREAEDKEQEDEEDEEGMEERYLPLTRLEGEESPIEERKDEVSLPMDETEEAGRGPTTNDQEKEARKKTEEEENNKEAGGTRGQEIKLEGNVEEYQSWDEKKGRNIEGVWNYTEWFNSHRVIPNFELEGIRWAEEAKEWLHLPIWVHGENQAEELHYYTDGSVSKHGGGAAAILYVRSGFQWFFAGYLQRGKREERDKISAYQMELDGMIMALKWADDEIKMHRFRWGSTPKIVMHFDAQSAGRGALGMNQGNLKETRYIMARAIAQAIENGMGATIEAKHEYAHTGVPGNEAADNLADHAGRKQVTQDPFWEDISKGNGIWCIQWMWWVYRGDIAQRVRGGDVYIPRPEAKEEEDVTKELEGYDKKDEKEDNEEEDKVCCKIVTFNVNTLKEAKGRRASIGLFEEMLKVMNEEKVTIFCLQETRIKVRLTNANPWYWIWQEEATSKGKGGVMIGISKVHPYEEGGKKIHKTNVKVVQGDEEHLLVKISTGSLNFALLNAHAPHSGHTYEELDRWWKNIRENVVQKCAGWELVTCIDANAKVGSMQSQAIGSHQMEKENTNGEFLHQYLSTTAQWIPSTFEKHQKGQGKTFTYPGGGEARLDYVCVPQKWKGQKITTEVQDQISTRDKLKDHRPATLQLEGTFQRKLGTMSKEHQPRFNIKDQGSITRFQQKLKAGTAAYDWNMDIHLHVHKMNQMILDAAREAKKGEPKKVKRKEYLSEETWMNVQIKRRLRREYFRTREEEKRSLLKECWNIWRSQNEDEMHEKKQDKQRRHKMAKLERRFRIKSKQVTKLVRKDDQDFYERLAQQMKQKR